MPDSIRSSPTLVPPALPERADGDFLATMYALDAAGEIQRATERIVDHLDDLLNARQFAPCNEILSQLDVDKLSAPLIVAFLGITRVAGDRLPARADFCARARAKLTAQIGAERAASLLGAYT